jgi:glucosamine--fructose-6-phosphate aminotransferase (isomerizing)
MMPHSEYPHAMYNAIHSQRATIESIASENPEGIQQLARHVRETRSTTLVGIGSSLHSAQLAVALWREVCASTQVSAEHSFDVANELTPLCAKSLGTAASDHLVVTFSHRGRKKYTVDALLLAHRLGTKTCAITGKGVTISPHEAHLHITTIEQERSSAHTASLIGSFAVCAAVAERLPTAQTVHVVSALQESISAGLSTEQAMQAHARQVLPQVRHLWIIGAGSDSIVAREIALKIKETSYIPSEGMSVEEFAHGPFQCVNPTDLILFVDTQPFASERIATVRAMAEVIGVPSLTVTTDHRASTFEHSARCVALPTNEIRTLNSISALVSLQLFTYFLALERGTDPDAFRLDDPKFKAAAQLIKL